MGTDTELEVISREKVKYVHNLNLNWHEFDRDSCVCINDKKREKM